MQSSRWLCWKWSVPNWASQRRQRQGTKTPSVTEWREKTLGETRLSRGGSSPPARRISSLFQLQQSQSVSGPLVPGVFPRWMSRWRGSSLEICLWGSSRRGCHRLFSVCVYKWHSSLCRHSKSLKGPERVACLFLTYYIHSNSECEDFRRKLSDSFLKSSRKQSAYRPTFFTNPQPAKKQRAREMQFCEIQRNASLIGVYWACHAFYGCCWQLLHTHTHTHTQTHTHTHTHTPHTSRRKSLAHQYFYVDCTQKRQKSFPQQPRHSYI